MQPNQPSPPDREQPSAGQPAQYAQPGQYGTPAPYAQPAQSGFGAPQAGAMPGVVKWGLGIQWVGVAFGVVGLIIGLLGLLALASTGEAGVAGLVGLLLAVAAVMIAVQVVVLVFAMKGRNWARITLAAIAILGIVISLASGQGLNLGSAISILSVALLFMPDATAWYRARSGQR